MFIIQPNSQFNKNLQTAAIDNIKLAKITENNKTRMTKRTSLIKRPQSNISTSNCNSVQTIYTQLHTYIQNLDQKIQNLLQKQSNEYKAVYQHYYSKFKEELQQLKQKTLEQEHQFLQNNHVHCLQSELKILKEEVSAYKTSYEQMKKENDELKTAIEFYKQDVAFLESNVKNRIKEIKILTSQNSKLESQLNRSSLNQTDLSKNQTHKSIDLKRRSHSMNIDDLSQPEIKIQFHKYNPNPVFKQLVSTKNIYEEYFFTDQSIKQNKTASNKPLMKKKSNQSFKGRIQYTHELSGSKEGRNLHTQESQKAQKNSKIFNICEWFLDCVETVRKQIFHRKSDLYTFQLDRMNNGFRYFDSLDGFLKLDKLQVIKLFLSSKEIIITFYHLLKSQKNIEVQDQEQKIFSNQITNQSQLSDQYQDEQIQPKFTNLTIQESTNRKIKKKSMTDMGFFDWKLAQKAQKFQNLSDFNTTAAVTRKKMYFSKSNEKKTIKTSDDRFNILLGLNPKKSEDQKNIKMMKKITAIINKKKSMPLTSQLFARKRSFFIE